MRYLWIISAVMIAAGGVLSAGGAAGMLDPVAFIFGVLLLWSGVVKIIVLRIWKSSLKAASAPERGRGTAQTVPISQHQ